MSFSSVTHSFLCFGLCPTLPTLHPLQAFPLWTPNTCLNPHSSLPPTTFRSKAHSLGPLGRPQHFTLPRIIFLPSAFPHFHMFPVDQVECAEFFPLQPPICNLSQGSAACGRKHASLPFLSHLHVPGGRPIFLMHCFTSALRPNKGNDNLPQERLLNASARQGRLLEPGLPTPPTSPLLNPGGP